MDEEAKAWLREHECSVRMLAYTVCGVVSSDADLFVWPLSINL